MASLVQVRIRNYRCFSDHTVDFSNATIVVGKNNAGKSTLIEALRLISVALRRFTNPASARAPTWLDDVAPGNGQKIDLARLGIQTSTLFHRYGDPPAILEAEFADSSRLIVYVGAEDAHAIFFNSVGRAVRSRRDAGALSLPTIAILPQITPLERDERLLVEDYVRSSMDSSLASRHFRNQLFVFRFQMFEGFKDLVEETWPGVKIDSLSLTEGSQGHTLQLMVRDASFVAEVGWMGHGLQMWLQTLWFVVRSQGAGTIVLDEPDVYLHPDLQRRLVRMLRALRPELVIATHSTEIMTEVDAQNILVLDRDLSRSTYATDLPSMQKVVEALGSAQNLQIARLWKSRKLILVEGDDMKVLRRICDLVCPETTLPLDTIPNWSIGGWNGWQNAIGAVSALKNSVDERIRCYCIFDSDYHTDEEIAARHQKAKEIGVELHVLSMKEIENYLVVPSLVRRAIEKNADPGSQVPTEEEIEEKIEEIVDGMLPDVRDRYSSELYSANRATGIAAANRNAREVVARKLERPRGKLGIAPGKEVVSQLSSWSKERFGASFGVNTLLRAMRRDEVSDELAEVVKAISSGASFSAS